LTRSRGHRVYDYSVKNTVIDWQMCH
jgi:hypothetical protein